ncbi:MAG: penicillin-binding protein 2 [Candidatus Omnitrophica bacterium]|nr:penicillin-binding protein 2 [Candidatus Omnitrophota bacterium]
MADSFPKSRLWILSFFVVSLFILIAYQLVQLTVIRRNTLLDAAERQHQLRVTIPPLRGRILDSEGKELATSLKVPSIYGVPRLLSSPERESLAHKVSDILKLDYKSVLERLSRDKSFVWLKRRVSFEEAEEIRKLEHAGLGILEEYKRFYPLGDLAAHVLGIVNIDNEGLEGIEQVYNYELSGQPGRRYTKRDAFGREIKAFEIEAIPAVNGKRIYLTINQYIQYITERALDAAYTKWRAKGATAVMMEAKTGRILALANRPTYDPNHPGESTADMRRNRAITDMYEPGSVFKIVAFGAVLNEKKLTLETMINCENGEYRYGSHVLHDAHPYGLLNVPEVLIKSSNIGTVKIAAFLEPKKYYEYILGFGFKSPTGIDLAGEATGFIRAPDQWSKTSAYNIPMGHEVMVTSIQMARAVAMLANGGNLVTPYIVEKVVDDAGVIIKQNQPVIKAGPLSSETTAIMRELMHRVVEEGTGKRAKIDKIPVGGKTGTAQKVLPNGKGYSHNTFMSSFVGFAPLNDPQIVMAVMLDDPRPSYYGGTVAAPVFSEAVESALYTTGYIPEDAEVFTPQTPDLPLEEKKIPPQIQPV